jgi:hypothetical protein
MTNQVINALENVLDVAESATDTVAKLASGIFPAAMPAVLVASAVEHAAHAALDAVTGETENTPADLAAKTISEVSSLSLDEIHARLSALENAPASAQTALNRIDTLETAIAKIAPFIGYAAKEFGITL